MHTFSELINAAKLKGPKRVVLIGGDDPVAIEALRLASESNLVKPILVGEKAKIKKITQEFEIVDTSPEDIPVKGASLVGSGKADILMKGRLPTSTFLRGMLDESVGLRTGRILSHIAVIESSLYHKLLLITDGGMIIKPDLQAKIDILLNAVDFAHILGIACPKVAVLAAIEKVSQDMPETLDAAELTKMGKEGKFGECKVDGPLALDIAVSKEACRLKQIECEIGGDADILLVPDIACGNIAAKSIVWLGGAKIGGMLVGARAPCVMLSRSDSKEIKINSIALGVISCRQKT